MIVIHPLRIAFQNVPKVATTSLFQWLYQLLPDGGIPLKKRKSLHSWFTTQQTDFVTNHPLVDFQRPDGYLVFCLMRDPVKRLLSAYRNRVLFHSELNSGTSDGDAAVSANLLPRPDLEYFVEHFDDYRRTSRTIRHHTNPMVDFIGQDLTIYDHVFDISEMDLLRDTLIEHWKKCNLDVASGMIPPIPRTQIGGPKIGLEHISAQAFIRLLDFYRADYECFPRLNVHGILREWSQAHEADSGTAVAGNRSSQKLVIKKSISDAVSHTFLGKNLNSRSIRGSVVLKRKLHQSDYKLTVGNGDKSKAAEWGVPSPKLAAMFPMNPNAAHAKFIARGMGVDHGKPIEVFLEKPDGQRDLLLRISIARGA